jgi:hypothetical protein
MAAVWDEDSDSDDEDGDAADPNSKPSSVTAAGSLADGSKGRRGNAGGSGRGRRSSKPRKMRKEGTAAGDNTRLFCFCPKHRGVAGDMSSSLIFQSSVSISAAASAGAAAAGVSNSAAGAGSVGAAAAAGQGQEVTSPRRLQSAHFATQQQQQQHVNTTGTGAAAVAAAGAAGSMSCPSKGVMLFGEAHAAAGSCARSRPADTAVRRGLRAPDALAAALRKRLYVQALPYLVTSSTRAGQLLPPPACRARLEGPEFTLEVQQLRQQEQQPQLDQLQQQHAEQQQKLSAAHALQSCFGSSCSRAGVAAADAVPFGGTARPSGVLSLADRHEAMKASAAARVCSGKSAIHGLGVFAKMPHKAGAQGCLHQRICSVTLSQAQ